MPASAVLASETAEMNVDLAEFDVYVKNNGVVMLIVPAARTGRVVNLECHSSLSVIMIEQVAGHSAYHHDNQDDGDFSLGQLSSPNFRRSMIGLCAKELIRSITDRGTIRLQHLGNLCFVRVSDSRG